MTSTVKIPDNDKTLTDNDKISIDNNKISIMKIPVNDKTSVATISDGLFYRKILTRFLM